MKTIIRTIPLALAVLALSGCGLANFVGNVRTIHASDTLVTETPAVSGITAIDMRTYGNVVLTQGESESLTIRGSNNVVPLVTTVVRGGVLTLETEPGILVNGMNSTNMLTFTIGVKDLAAITLSGAGNITMAAISAPGLDVTMSGAGKLNLGGISAGTLHVTISGAGDADLSGDATNATINISGAGNVNAPDLKVGTATVGISGVGNATLWVTNSLDGTISGAGNVSYYGAPQVSTKTTGVGRFHSLGNK
jgi:hypothetical protein